MEVFLKTKKAMEKVKVTPFNELPTVKKVCMRMKEDENDTTKCTYQGTEVTKYKEALEIYSYHYSEYVENVQVCILNRIKASSTDLLTHALTILAPAGWEKTIDASFGYSAISSRFSEPLEKAGVDCACLQEKWDDIIDYAK